MKKALIVLTVIASVTLAGVAFAHYWGHGGYGRGYGGQMMGPGYGGYGGHMMGPGYGGYCWGEPPGAYEGKALTEKDAESIARRYIGRNPNLKVGKIEDKENSFEAEILTKDNSLVTRLFIDKTTGWAKPIY